MAHQYNDGTWGFCTFLNGKTYDGVRYTGGTYNLDEVGGRLVLGDWYGPRGSEAHPDREATALVGGGRVRVCGLAQLSRRGEPRVRCRSRGSWCYPLMVAEGGVQRLVGGTVLLTPKSFLSCSGMA